MTFRPAAVALLGLLNARRTSAESAANYTPQVREYEWTVAHAISSDDPTSALNMNCYDGRLMTLIDGGHPGPTLRANVGDTVRVKIKSALPAHGTSIHWHGLHMSEEPYMDGVSKFTQCILPPMETQTYEFVAREPGTHYWHSHTALQHSNGLAGPLYVYDGASESNDFFYGGFSDDEGGGVGEYDGELELFLQDWYHKDASTQLAGLQSEPFRWIFNPQSILINGRGTHLNADEGTCAPPSTLEVEPGKTYRIRIVNSANLVALNVAIAGHVLTIVEADGTPTMPVAVETLDVSPGQRYSVLLTASGEPGTTYAVSVHNRARNMDSTAPGLAYLKYSGTSEKNETDGGGNNMTMPEHPEPYDFEAPYGLAFDATLRTKDVPPEDKEKILDADPDLNYIIVGTQNRRPSDNVLRWAVNNVSLTSPDVTTIAYMHDRVRELGAWADANEDLDVGANYVDLPKTPPTTWNYTQDTKNLLPGPGPALNLTAIPIVRAKVGQVIQMIFQNSRALNGAAELHPWHFHGHSFYQVGMGEGTYDPAVHDQTFNLDDPLRRDTFILWPDSWVAVKFQAYHPGVWDMHCHLNSHLVMGMGFLLVVSPDELDAPPAAALSCDKQHLNSSGEEEEKPEDGTSAAASISKTSAVLLLGLVSALFVSA